MNRSLLWLVLALVACPRMCRATNVKLVILREEALSPPEDKVEETSEEEEDSNEMDWLVDLIGKESTDTPSVSKLVKSSKKQTEQVADQSQHKETLLPRDKDHHEYHVHYHNHKHIADMKNPGFAADTIHPILWDSGSSPLDGFNEYLSGALSKEPSFLENERFEDFKDFGGLDVESKPRASRYNLNSDRFRDFKDFETQEDDTRTRSPRFNLNSERFKHFKDFETLLDTQSKPPVPPNDRFRDFKDFDTLTDDVDSPQDDGRSVDASRFKNFKDFETFLDDAPEARRPRFGSGRFQNIKEFDALLNHPPSKSLSSGGGLSKKLKDFEMLLDTAAKTKAPKQQHRFENFKDFETLVDAGPKPYAPKTEKFRDLDIVVKMPQKNRSPYNVHYVRGSNSGFKSFGVTPFKYDKYAYRGHHSNSFQNYGPPKYKPATKPMPPMVRKNPPPPRSFGGPKILDFPGGTPKHIEKLNQLNYGKMPSAAGSTAKRDFAGRGAHGSLGRPPKSSDKAVFQVRPVQNAAQVHKKPLNGWIIRRLQ